MTNNQVIECAEKIAVIINDGHEYEVTITGRFPLSDISVIEIKTADLNFLQLGDS